MIDATQKKLREARFFVLRLNEESRQAVRNEPEAFDFFLSAFLSAARSVTFALQYEEKGKYDEWFSTWSGALTDDDRNLMDCLKTQRNATQKKGGAEIDLEWQFVPITDFQSDNPGHPAYGFHWFGPPGTPPPQIGRPTHFFNLGNDKPEVFETCRRYVALLDKLVEDFLNTYAETKSS